MSGFASTYLVEPLLFPARFSGDSLGPHAVSLPIARERVGVEGLSDELLAAARTRFGALLLPGAPAGGPRVRVFHAPPSDFVPLDLKGRELTMDVDWEEGGVRLAGPGFCARLSHEVPRAALFVSHGDPFAIGALENVLRVLTAYRLAEQGGALLHSAAVRHGGDGALLFPGRSGAGKTTLCTKSREEGREVLSDELNAVFPGPAGPRIVALPFAGDYGPAAPGEERSLSAVVDLRKGAPGERAHLAPLPRARAIAQLFARAPFVNGDPYRRDRLFTNLERLFAEVPLKTLTFSLEEPVWPALEESTT